MWTCFCAGVCVQISGPLCVTRLLPPVLRSTPPPCGVESRGTAGGAQHHGREDISRVWPCTLCWLQPTLRGLGSSGLGRDHALYVVGKLRPGPKVCSLLAVLQAPFPDQTAAGAGDGAAETAAVGGPFVASPVFLARPKPSVEIFHLSQPFTSVQTGTAPT